MKVLLDTSVLVAALVPAHEHHARCRPWLARTVSGDARSVVATHSLAEIYAVLTTLPLRPRLSPAIAVRLVEENITRHAEVVGLTPVETLQALRDAAAWGLSGGVTHDAMIARVAKKARVEALITLNVADFRRAWPDGAALVSAP